MPVDYQRHGRRHRAGGEDPIPGLTSLPWCGLSRTTGVTIDSGSSYDTDEFVEWETFAQLGGSYFAEMTDGNGVPGVKILQPGLYSVQSVITVRENNASDYVPPTLRWIMASCLDGTDDFGTTSFPSSLTGGWLAQNPAGTPYVAPTISPVSKQIVLGGTFTWAFTADELGANDSITGRIVSEGGADEWQYYPALLWLFYVGSVAE